MAGDRDLTYKVGVDASDAVGGLKKLDSAVKSTMGEVEDELEEGASAGDKFAASMDRLASQLKADFDKSATAAGELKRALAEVDSGIDVGDAVAELSRMGFTFDEITADADKFAASLKQLDDVRLDGVKQLDAVAPGLATKLDDVSKAADSSKSVLANMVGNASQDLGALGGLAGSAGVAIGQMGEYMADAAFSGEGLGSVVKNFAAVAGPIAALSAGVMLLTGMVQAYAEPAKQAAERTKEVGEAMDDTTSDTLAFIRVLRDNKDDLQNFELDRKDGLGKFNDALTRTLDFIPGIGKAQLDVIEIAGRMDLSMYDLAKQLAGTGDTTEEFTAQLDAAVAAQKVSSAEAKFLAGAIGEYGDAAKQAAKDSGLFNVNAEEASEILADLTKQADPLAAFGSQFTQVMDDMRDGTIHTESAASAINSLADALGWSEEQVIAFAREQLDEEMKDVADATGGATTAAERHADALERQAEMTDNARVANEKLRGDLNKREAILNLEQTFDDLGAAGAQAMKDVHDGTLDAETATRGFELQQIAAKEEVLSYIDSIGEIPVEKETEILAAVNRGDYDEAMRLLGLLQAPVEIPIRFKFDQAKLNQLLSLQAQGPIVSMGRGTTERLTGVRD